MRRRHFFLACALMLAAASQVHAHAFLDHAAPVVGSTVHGSPSQIKLWFTQTLEPAFSTVRVLDAANRQVDKSDAKAAAALLQVSVPPLAPGRYRVVWRVLSTDTHVTEGDFTFDVAP